MGFFEEYYFSSISCEVAAHGRGHLDVVLVSLPSLLHLTSFPPSSHFLFSSVTSSVSLYFGSALFSKRLLLLRATRNPSRRKDESVPFTHSIASNAIVLTIAAYRPGLFQSQAFFFGYTHALAPLREVREAYQRNSDVTQLVLRHDLSYTIIWRCLCCSIEL